MNKKLLFMIFAFISVLNWMPLSSQNCKIYNDVFQGGEELNYDLYFKYGILYTKAGNSKLSVTNTTYGGKNAYKMILRAQSSGAVDKLFSLNDTLTSYMSKDLVPLSFSKNAYEGKDYTIETIKYTYTSKGVSLNTKRVKNGTERFDVEFTSTNCIYDFLSIVFYARTLDYSTMKKGSETSVEFMSGKRKVKMVIEHRGIEKMKANDGKKYNCIKLLLSISDDAFENKEEAMTVYITNDNNRMPVRIDSKLKVGSTRAILKKYKGNKHTIE